VVEDESTEPIEDDYHNEILESMKKFRIFNSIEEIGEFSGKIICDIGGTEIDAQLFVGYQPLILIVINNGLLSHQKILIDNLNELYNNVKTQVVEKDFRYPKFLLKYISNNCKEIEDRITDKRKAFDLIFLSKILHHIRGGRCILHNTYAETNDRNHDCDKKSKDCILKFRIEVIEKILQYGEKMLVWEQYDPYTKDNDKETAVGGHLSTNEWKDLLQKLYENGNNITFFEPINKKYTSEFRIQDEIFADTLVGMIIQNNSSEKTDC